MRVMVIAFLLLVLGCAADQVSKKGDIYVQVGGKAISNNGTATFPGAATGSQSLSVVIGNAGDAPLTIKSITVKEGGNAYMSVQPPFAPSAFPHVVAANDLEGATAITFKVKYTPGAKYDDRATVFVVESDDYDQGTFTFSIAPQANAPQIKVIPDNITFVGATASDPGIQCFEVTNTGTAVLKIEESLSFESPTNEFQIIPPSNAELEDGAYQECKKGTQIDPELLGGANRPCKFCVRYKPVDTPDTNFVVIKSNDPTTPIKRVKVEGVSEPGHLQVTKSDPTCLDFQKIEQAGESCTKVIKLYNAGPGAVLVDRPKFQPNTLKAYAVNWYKVSAESSTMECGYTPGPNTEITQNQYRIEANDSVDVTVTYTSPGGKGENGTLVITYKEPNPGRVEIQLCGGSEKCMLEIAPPTGTQLVFHAKPKEVKKKTVVLMNKGNGKCLVHYAKVPEDGSDVEGAFVVNPPVNENVIEPSGLFLVTVEFHGDLSEEFVIANGHLEVSYQDSYTGNDVFQTVNMTGHRGDFEGVELPTAVPVARPAPDQEAIRKDYPMTLDGSGSIAGTYEIFAKGYRWFVTDKPPKSQVFLNVAGEGAQTVVTPDVTGHYEFRLEVFSASPDNQFYFSDEGSVSVEVVP